MIYRSNLTAPDLTPHFKHLVSRPMAHSFGHDVPSDWGDKADDDPVFGLYKRCGMWTHDEAAILYCVAMTCSVRGWIDIGSHTGWTTAHIAAIGTAFYAIDPMYAIHDFQRRALDNLNWTASGQLFPFTSSGMFSLFTEAMKVSGFCIDGDHEPGEPLKDAQNSVKHLADTGVIMLHDGTGQPVREAVEWLMRKGMKCRAYFTPHLVFCCWRGDFVPPDHEPDQKVKNAHLDGRYPDFDFSRCV